MNAVEIVDLTFQFNQQTLFSNFNFSLEQNKWTVLLGRSGVGKSTLLRIIAGLEKTTTQSAVRFTPKMRLAWLAQQDCLLPWLNVIDNVQLYAHLNGQKNNETKKRAYELLCAVQMEMHAEKFCYQLSGGQRQRVALARTLMQDADIILMDEPFSALDAITRLQLQNLACELLRDKTVLLITHDPQEAIRLAHNLYILQSPNAQGVQLYQLAKLTSILPNELPPEQFYQLQQQIITQLTTGEKQ